jgi:GntR family transcriptional regulator
MGESQKRKGKGSETRGADSRQPLYTRVYEAIREGIAVGEWTPGDNLPTEADLCARFDVSRITVRHALQLLRQDGYITTQAAKPAVVVSRRSGRGSAGKVDTLDDLIAVASDAALEIRSWRPEPSPEAARIFGLLAATPLHCLTSLLMRDRQPFARSRIFFHPTAGSRLGRKDFGDVIVFRTMQRVLGVRILDVKMTVWSEAAREDDAADLGVAAGSPMLCTRLVYRTVRNAPVEIAYTRYPADAYSITHTIDIAEHGP